MRLSSLFNIRNWMPIHQHMLPLATTLLSVRPHWVGSCQYSSDPRTMWSMQQLTLGKWLSGFQNNSILRLAKMVAWLFFAVGMTWQVLWIAQNGWWTLEGKVISRGVTSCVGMTAQHVLLAQTKIGFLTGGRGYNFQELNPLRSNPNVRKHLPEPQLP